MRRSALNAGAVITSAASRRSQPLRAAAAAAAAASLITGCLSPAFQTGLAASMSALARAPAAQGGGTAKRAAVTRRASAVDEWFASQGIEVDSKGGGGGSGWSSTSIIKTNKGDFFVKTANRPAKDMFEGEALGLRALGAAGGVRVPKVLHYGDDGPGRSFIIMEKLDMGGRPDMRSFGRAMAQLHLAQPADPRAQDGEFGFAVDNTIGGTPQLNPWTKDWPTFFREHRIGYQVQRAGRPELTAAWKKALEKTNNLEDLFTDEEVKPSVLHGDLWSGNYAACSDGATIYDPAVYYGHHEAEWGMSWCASFTSDFWAGYREILPEAPLFQKRRALYDAYHQLNHYNLFGGHYLNEAEYLLQQLGK